MSNKIFIELAYPYLKYSVIYINHYMKNIVIAAGYATRLGELTRNFPKPLLQIGENTILGRMIDDIDRIEDVDEHIIVTNHKFAHIFKEWAAETKYSKPITIVDDGTETNDTRQPPVFLIPGVYRLRQGEGYIVHHVS